MLDKILIKSHKLSIRGLIKMKKKRNENMFQKKGNNDN